MKSREELEAIKNKYPQGTKVTLIKMVKEDQMPEGLKGVVRGVDDDGQIHVAWENGSSLALIEGLDEFEIDEIQVVLVEPEKPAKLVTIKNSLEAEQQIVGGYIQAIYPFEDEVALICNDEGKLNCLPLNRAIYNEFDENEMIDIIAYAPSDSDQFHSLPKDLADKYYQKFKDPEVFFRTAKDKIISKKVPLNKQPSKTTKHKKTDIDR